MPPFQFQPYEPRYAGTIGDLMQAPARARAQALRESAAAQARAAEIGGQASAGAATNINNAVAGSLGAYMQRKEQAPVRAAQALDLEAKQLAVDQAKRETAEEQQLRALFAKNPEPKPDEIYGIVGPKRGTDIVKGIAALRQENQKTFKSTQELVGSMTGAVLALPEGMRADAYTTARQNLVQRGVVQPQDIPEQYDPAFLQQAHVWALTPDKQQDVLNPKPIEVSPNATLVAPGTDGKLGPVYTAPAAPEKTPTAGSFEDYVRRGALEQGKTVADLKPADIEGFRKKYQQADDRPQVNVNMNADDSAAIADAIANGDQPPTLQGLYRNGAQVRAALAKKGFNLAQATIDWQATTKHLATLNGAQQTRMRQAVDNAAHSLDVIEDLASQWDGGKFPLLNKAQLVAAKQGALGEKAQQIATQLEAQISDVTSELGNVYMGGNSPTDHALTLAGKNLSADWTKAQLVSALNLARKNLQIRSNSMKNVGPAGASAGNPYNAPESPAAGAGADPLGILK